MVAHSATSVSALSHGLLCWHDIDWCHVEQTVRALQIRIAKACKANNWRKVESRPDVKTPGLSGESSSSGFHPKIKG
ncbi:hypothetical protein XNC3_40008 [Xenorhabdus nematophila F1]|nr:hypothetical protein XNC3_40008 [Xenorhabdus nematophila F1]